MGKHGQGMLEELLLGSVAKYVLSESASDVLVVSPGGYGAMKTRCCRGCGL